MSAWGPGSRVGRYVILTEVGKGPQGPVYQAYDPDLDRKVMLRQLPLLSLDPAQDRSLAEAQALAKLSHPHVISAYDTVAIDGQVFVAMEWVAGKELPAWLAQNRPGSRQMVSVLLQAGRGISAAHQAGLVLRDFDASHILVGDDGRVRVMDFCLAPEDPRDRQAADQMSYCLVFSTLCFGQDAGEVHRRIRKSVERGLSANPTDRYPSMAALLRQLSIDPLALRRRRWLMLIVVLLIIASAAFAHVWQAEQQAFCQGAEHKLTGIWDPSVKKAMRNAFEQTKRAHAPATYARVEKVLDRQAAAWVKMRTEACEATHLRGEQSALLLDKRMHCLDRRLRELHALVRLFVDDLDATVVDHAVRAAFALARLDKCADTGALLAVDALPEQVQIRAQITAVRDQLARARAALKAGKYASGLALAGQAEKVAAGIDYPPLQAEARYTLGALQAKAGKALLAKQSLQQAIRQAARGKEDSLLAMAATELALVVGHHLARYGEGIALAEVAEAAVVRAGNDGLLRANILSRLGILLARQGHYDQALAKFSRALSMRQKLLRADHPLVGMSLNNQGLALKRLGREEEAKKVFARAIEMVSVSLGPEHPEAANAHGNLGNLLNQQGWLEEAQRHHRQALAIREQVLGPAHPDTAISLDSLGSVLFQLGRYQEAKEAHLRALEIWETSLGPEHLDLTYALVNLASDLERLGKLNLARAHLERALAIMKKNQLLEHPEAVYALNVLGQVLITQGQFAQANEVLAKAVHIVDSRASDPNDMAHVLFLWARAMWAEGKEKQRALKMVRRARRLLTGDNPRQRQQAQALDKWIVSH